MFSRYIPVRYIRTFQRVIKNQNILKSEEVSLNKSAQTADGSLLSNKESIPINEYELQNLAKRANQKHSNSIVVSELEDEIRQKDIYPPKERLHLVLDDYGLPKPLIHHATINNQDDLIKDAVCPLHNLTYSQQLKLKHRQADTIMRRLKEELKRVKAPFEMTPTQLPCHLEQVVPSPKITEYRNKDKFSVQCGMDGNPKTVGHFYGTLSDPLFACLPITNVPIIKETHKLVAKHFESFIRESPHPACLQLKDGGIWRRIIVRSTEDGELMLAVIISPPAGENAEEVKSQIEEDLVRYFFEGPGAECQLSSLYLQACPHSKCSSDVAPYKLLKGKAKLVEKCLGKSFVISPDSFFQANTLGAERLFETVAKVLELNSLSTILDVCCGTGAMSVMLSKGCAAVHGLDSSSSAINDARTNADMNGIVNAYYSCGKVDKALSDVTSNLRHCIDLVTVVNSARAGLHTSVIMALRRCESITKLVFVTSKPEGRALHNMGMLGSTLPASYKAWGRLLPDDLRRNQEVGPPFGLRYAIPVDMCPQTTHSQYVMLFQRLK